MHRVLVSQIMQRSVVTTHPTVLAAAAAQKMEEFAIRRLPVVDDNNCLVGIVTDADVLEADTADRVLNRYEPGAETKWLAVADVMTRTVITIGPDATVGELVILFMQHKIGGVPVVKASPDYRGLYNVVGIVSETDIFRLIAEAWHADQAQE